MSPPGLAFVPSERAESERLVSKFLATSCQIEKKRILALLSCHVAMNFHAHSSALLRSRIQAIIEQRASSRSSSSSTNDLENLGNVIVSHPPTPTLSSYPGMNAESCAMSSRPFSTTEPFELSERIPLSDLDRKGTEKATEDDFGLILVTGQSVYYGS